MLTSECDAWRRWNGGSGADRWLGPATATAAIELERAFGASVIVWRIAEISLRPRFFEERGLFECGQYSLGRWMTSLAK